MRRKILIWGVVPALGVFAALATTGFLLLRPAHLRTMVQRGLAEHLNLDVEIGELELAFWPRPRVFGSHIAFRIPDRPGLPPIITVDHFFVDVGPMSALRKHVETLHLGGLRIVVPPPNARGDLTGPNATEDSRSKIIIDRIETHDAELTFAPKKAGDTPLLFAIHDLTIHDVGFGRSMPYEARLTNPIPRGLVEATGRIGPWNPSDPTSTRLGGQYTFTDAKLETINGIGGILASTGTFEGQLTAINVTGTATVPDFSLDLGGKPVRLDASFDTTVDGTDGTTTLRRVDAKMAATSMRVTGAIANLEGPGRHDVLLDVKIDDGRIEDILALAIDSPRPIMTGDLTLATHMALPPGKIRVRDRLQLAGTFGLGRTNFTSGQVQAKLQELSRRSQGKDPDEAMGRVLTNLRGKFALRGGVLKLTNLTFQVPGATVALDGTYLLADGAMDMSGELRMQASVSKAIGGFKSIFIRPFDRLFRRNGSGSVVPIRISGTREAPKFGVEMGRVFKKGK